VANAELSIENQIAYLDAILQYDQQKLQSCNPFLGISVEAILMAIRKSLVELQEIKNKK
jgi:hypothetical protein